MSSNIKIKKICQQCGQEFIARTTVTKYCGDNCAKKAYKVKVSAYSAPYYTTIPLQSTPVI
uniref:hypothetical protein n=1 Tax=Sphingobacterium multivorum TaxID=28454 RepID=UPI0028B10B01